MGEIMTTIGMPGRPRGDGMQDYGEKSAPEMIAQIRAYAAHLRERVEAIERTPDHGFQIDIVQGVHRQRHVREVQAATPQAPLPRLDGEAS